MGLQCADVCLHLHKKIILFIMSPTKYLACFMFVIVSSAVQCKTIYSEKTDPLYNKISPMEEEQGKAEIAVTLPTTNYSEALEEVKAVAGRPSQTGDANLEKVLGKKRCGVKDIVESSKSGRVRRYVLNIGGGWTKRHITYRVLNGARTLSKYRVEQLVAAAFAKWAPYGGLQFTRLDYGHADIMISFVRPKHGDGYDFDGPTGLLAHATFPSVSQESVIIHFDDDEFWVDYDSPFIENGVEFFAVALHEIGHTLGLHHSEKYASAMYADYKPGVRGLYEDDILAMQALYQTSPHRPWFWDY